MADKQTVRRGIQRLKHVETWQLVILLILAGFLAATFLRLNNIAMADRRAAVLAADKIGNADDIQSRLYDLQRYVSGHMNTDTSAFYLQGQYDRDVEKAAQTASSSENAQGSVNGEIDKICKSRVSGYGQAWIQCFTEELAKLPAAPDPTTAIKLPDPELYRHDFAAPVWSPDFAGWTVAVCGLLTLMIILRILRQIILFALLRYHYRSI